MMSDAPRHALTAAVAIGFGYAIVNHWSAGLEEVLQSIVMLVVGYWFGSSKGSADKTRHMAAQASGKARDPVHIEEERL